MEEKQMNENKSEFKGNLGFIWLVGILVILLGCTIVYVCKLKREVNDLKQTPQIPPQQVQPAVTTQENSIVESTENKTTETTENTVVNTTLKTEPEYKKYIGKWHGEIADAGGVTITIKEKNGKLDIKWVKNFFNLDPAREFKVKNYNIKNDKLYIELEKNDYYVENNYIIYKKNKKIYITVKNDKGNDFFPYELVKE